MKTEFKHIYFIDASIAYPKRKTQTWSCRNKKCDVLGQVRWYAPWRQYCFFTEPNIIYAKSCLIDIAYFIIHLNMEHKK